MSHELTTTTNATLALAGQAAACARFAPYKDGKPANTLRAQLADLDSIAAFLGQPLWAMRRPARPCRKNRRHGRA